MKRPKRTEARHSHVWVERPGKHSTQSVIHARRAASAPLRVLPPKTTLSHSQPAGSGLTSAAGFPRDKAVSLNGWCVRCGCRVYWAMTPGRPERASCRRLALKLLLSPRPRPKTDAAWNRPKAVAAVLLK